MRIAHLLVLLLGLGLCTGCTDENKGHDHDHEHAHDDHDHDHDHDHPDADEDHGTRHARGTINTGAATGNVFQLGPVQAGSEAHIEFEPGAADAVTAVRVWIGNEAGKGVMKTLADKQKSGIYHAHVEVKPALPEDAKIWVEVETTDGQRQRGSVAIHDEVEK